MTALASCVVTADDTCLECGADDCIVLFGAGDCLCAADDRHVPGKGTFERSGYIYSCLVGRVHRNKQEDGVSTRTHLRLRSDVHNTVNRFISREYSLCNMYPFFVKFYDLPFRTSDRTSGPNGCHKIAC